jgi:hypothetical protein
MGGVADFVDMTPYLRPAVSAIESFIADHRGLLASGPLANRCAAPLTGQVARRARQGSSSRPR